MTASKKIPSQLSIKTADRLKAMLAEMKAKKAMVPEGIKSLSQGEKEEPGPTMEELIAKGKTTSSVESQPRSPERTAELVQKQLESAFGPKAATMGIQYNQKQQELIQWISNWKPPKDRIWDRAEDRELVFIGAAGTGKTTAIRGSLQNLLEDQEYPILHSSSKYLQIGMKGVVCVSYTNKAVAQVKRNVPPELKDQCLTIHKLIEFEPVFYEVIDEITGEIRVKMRFEPMRKRENPLPASLRTLIIDESSMVDERLFKQLKDALPSTCRIVYIGDLNQLPPVFGDAILGRKMCTLPVIELTEVYRQALDSPIIRLAWNILRGEANLFAGRSEEKDGKFVVPSYRRFNEAPGNGGKVKIIPWAKKTQPHIGLNTIVKKFNALADSGEYLPMEDMILIPYNVQLGTIEANKGIAQHLGVKRGAVVHEVISGINKLYLAVGDKVLHAKEEYLVTEIVRNGNYSGPPPRDPSTALSRHGVYLDKAKDETILQEQMDVDALLESLGTAEGKEDERFNQASHIIRLQNLFDPEIKVELATSGEVNNLLFAYAITVHKSQGSEWRRVFLVLHHSHKTMHYRELLYTAVTRAREELTIYCEPNSIERCIKNPRIKGNKLAEKLEFLRARFAEKDSSVAGMEGDGEEGTGQETTETEGEL